MRNRNGLIDVAPRLVKETACFGSKYLRFDNASQSIGPTQDRSTSGSFARLTGKLIVMYPMIVSSIIWDVRIADTYICRFVTAQNGTTSLYDINTSVVVAAGGAITITPTDGDFLLLPGVYYLQLATHDAATVQWYDKNASVTDYTYLLSQDVYYTTSQYDYTIPARLQARVAIFQNMTEYSK